MTPLEVFAILVLAGAVIVLLYYYLQDNSKINLSRVKSDATNLGENVYGEASNLGEKVQGTGEKVYGEGSMSGMGEKLNVSGVSEKVTGMGEKIKGKVSVPISTDNLSHRIDLFLKLAHFRHERVEIVIRSRIAHLGGNFVVTLDEVGNRANAVHHVAANILVRIQFRLLREISHACAICGPGLAGEFRIQPAHDLHERRFTRAVDADDGDLGTRQEAERYIIQDLLPAGIGLGQVFHDVNVLIAHGYPDVWQPLSGSDSERRAA